MATLNLSEKTLNSPGNDALIASGNKISWYDFQKQVFAASHTFQNLGISAEDRIAVQSGINPLFPIIFFALLKCRAVILPLRPDLPEILVRKYTDMAGCRSLISLEKNSGISGRLPIPVITHQKLTDALSSTTLSQERVQLTALEFPSEQAATILFTSGSSGDPKGIIHSIGNHFFSALGANQNMPLSAGDRWMIVLPFFHVSGISILFRTMIAGAASVIGETKQSLSGQLNRYGITHLSLVPLQLQRLMEEYKAGRTFPALKAVLAGGGQCPPALTKKALKAGLPLYLSYGSTEMASQITTAGPADLLSNFHSSGYILPYRRVEIGSNDEILVGGKTLGELLNKAGETAGVTASDRLYPSGDTGRFDKDGCLIVTGRRDNMFISGGENIHPEEIENALLALDNVAAACVVPVPDSTFGERPVAFVCMRSGEVMRDKHLRTALEGVLPRAKIPIRFISWKPEEGQLKPERSKLRRQAMIHI